MSRGRVLVSGNEGFVGSHFQRELVARGVDVVGFDIKSGVDARKYFPSQANGPHRFDLLVHCAANVGGRVKIDGDPLWIANNLVIDRLAFDYALKTETPILYFSSSAAYPTMLQRPGWTYPLHEDEIDFDANDIGLPDSTYGWSKLTGEYLARHAGTFIPVHVVRPFSGYGEDQALDYPFPSFAKRAAEGADPFDIWGDGTQVRDFIHIDDIVRASLLMVERGILGPVNLGSGEGTSFNSLAKRMCQYAGYQPEYLHHPTAPTGVHYRVSETHRLKMFYQPEVSLDEGIARAIDYWKERG